MKQGITLMRDVISPLEERALIGAINGVGWKMLGCARAVQEYGYNYHFRKCGKKDKEFHYEQSYLDYLREVGYTDKIELKGLPVFVAIFVELMRWRVGRGVNQLIINRYLPGERIKLHKDTEIPCEWFSSLSLGAEVPMTFKDGDTSFEVSLPGRSLLLVEGEAFFRFKHGIKPVHAERISVTGRCLRNL